MSRRYRRRKRGTGLVFLFALVCMISLGYSILSSSLEIDGTAKIAKTTWDVHYENVKVTTGSVNASTPEILDDTTIKYSINFTTPGEFYEFEFDVVNSGTIDAVINKIVQTDLTDKQKKYLTYSLSYADGNVIKIGDKLNKNEERTIKVRLDFKSDVNASDLPTDDEIIKMKLETEYIQDGALGALSDWNNDGVLKVLTIGNSYSQDAMMYTYQVGKDLGVEKMELAYLYIGGCSLATHLSNATNDSASYIYYTNTNGTWSTKSNYKISDAVVSNDWDYIIFQQYSGASGKEDTYDSLVPLMEKVKESISEDANPKFAWHMTWAYAEGYSGLSNYNNSQITMYNGIVNAVKNKVVTNKEISIIIPNGTAIQNARTALGDTLNRDGTHLSNVDGRYIAALMYIKSLTGANLDNLNYVTAGGSSNLKEIAIKSVNAAYKEPFKVTSIENQTTPSPDTPEPDDPKTPELNDCDGAELEGYKCLSLELRKGFYMSTSNFGRVDTSANIAPRYWTTKIFEKSDLPNGTIIKVSSGWEYRPEGWIEEKALTGVTRPSISKASETIVDDTWWGVFNYRAFNIDTNPSGTEIWDKTEDEINAIFKIYVPINGAN